VDKQDRWADLGFERCGVNGVALAGAFAELAGRGFRHRCPAGASAGAVAAVVVAAGNAGTEVEQFVTADRHFLSIEGPEFHELGREGDTIGIAKRKRIHEWLDSYRGGTETGPQPPAAIPV